MRGGVQGGNGNGGVAGISFLESVYFRYCGIVERVNRRCMRCRPGRVALTGTDLCV